jgi:hypothetical protein
LQEQVWRVTVLLRLGFQQADGLEGGVQRAGVPPELLEKGGALEQVGGGKEHGGGALDYWANKEARGRRAGGWCGREFLV